MNVVAVAMLFSLSSAVPGGHHDHHGEAEGPVDLHSGKHCTDISFYGEVEYKDKPTVCCNTEFVKKCEDIKTKVCVDVTEVKCKAVAWAECTMKMEPNNATVSKYKPIDFDVTQCYPYTYTVEHTKLLPNCTDVTKLNCITNWEISKDGSKRWTGNEECTPVTWKECTLVNTTVPFNVTKTRCEVVSTRPWMDCFNSTKPEMTSSLNCEVKRSTDCSPTERQDCVWIEYQECKEVPELNCEEIFIKKPFQEKVHQKKCLFSAKRND